MSEAYRTLTDGDTAVIDVSVVRAFHDRLEAPVTSTGDDLAGELRPSRS